MAMAANDTILPTNPTNADMAFLSLALGNGV